VVAARDGKGHRMSTAPATLRTTVIVVDMLNGFCRFGNLASPRLDSVTERIRSHLEREVEGGADLVFLADTHAPDDPEFAMFPPHCVEGSGEEEIVPELAALAEGGHVVRKRRYSGFYGTELDEVLRRLRPDVVEVVGVCTDICVMHTVAGLRDRDYEVVVRADMVATYDAPGHAGDEIDRFALDHMRDVLGARVEGAAAGGR
jgi:nicotinamidase/pyrazinamidase